MTNSSYCEGVQCPKIPWLNRHKMKLKAGIPEDKARTIREVKAASEGYFPKTKSTQDENNKLFVAEEISAKTQTLMEAEETVDVIANVGFQCEGNYCSVDLLRRDGDGWQIIEVKSSTSMEEDCFQDLAYQYYIMEKCGVKVTGAYVMHLNSEYVRGGELEVDKLFKLEECSKAVAELQSQVPDLLDKLEAYANSASEPFQELHIGCDKPYECGFKAYCHRDVPEQSVFSISRLTAKKKYELYQSGIVTYEDIMDRKPKLSEKQWKQVQSAFYNESDFMDREAIRSFLDTLEYPLYHLDFETYQQAIPRFDGVSPYMQIPFQYSLHIEQQDGTLEHREFLGKEGVDTRRALAEQLCRDIPMGVCSMAYNMSFEKTVIKNLAKLYPDLEMHLMDIHDHMHDLMIPFRDQSYYSSRLQGSYSIKYVLPAMCGDDPEIDYHALEGVHNGSEAMAAFADLQNHPPDEIERIRTCLLAYCRLDTLAMVKVLEKLRGLAGECD